MELIDFIKKHVLLCLETKRNSLGDLVIGYNRPSIHPKETTTVETANKWIIQDIEKARKELDKNYQMGHNEPCVFLLFHLNRKRWGACKAVLDLIKNGELTKAALAITNANWFSKNVELGVLIATKVAKGEESL